MIRNTLIKSIAVLSLAFCLAFFVKEGQAIAAEPPLVIVLPLGDSFTIIPIARTFVASNLSVVNPGQEGALRLSWAAATSITTSQQTLHRADASNGNYNLIATLGAGTSSFVNTGLNSGQRYYYYVKTFAGGTTQNSNIADGVPTPQAPTNLNITPAVGGKALNLSWNLTSSASTTEQRIYRSFSPGGPYTLVQNIANNSSTSYQDSGLVNDRAYYYVLRAYDGTIESGNSVEQSGIPLETLLLAPQSLSVSDAPQDGALDLTWQASSSAGVTQQRLYRSPAPGGPYQFVTAPSATAVSYRDTGLNSGQRYYYVIRALNSETESKDSAEASGLLINNVARVLSGTVRAINGSSVVSGAQVHLYQNGVQQAVTTSDGSGLYSFSGLQAGGYQLSCSAAPLLSNTENITMTQSANSSADCKLQGTQQTAAYIYDQNGPGFGLGLGRLTTVIDATGNDADFEFDQRGQVIRQKRTIDGVPYTFTNTYDNLGRLDTMRYPDNDTVQYHYTNNGLLEKVTDASAPTGTTPYISFADFTEKGQPQKQTFGNGVVTDTSYSDLNFRVESIFTSRASSNQCFQSMTYEYDLGGNVDIINDYRDPTSGGCSSVPGSNTQSFAYDHLNRLVLATGPYAAAGAIRTLNYAYNQIGNMLCNQELSNCTASSPDYLYPTGGFGVARPHAVQTAAGENYLYDDNGNMTSGRGKIFTYDYSNKTARITKGGATIDLEYDASEKRIKKTVSGSGGTAITRYISKLYECTEAGGGTACVKHLFAGALRFAMKDNTSILYIHGDHLGSSNVITDSVLNGDGSVKIVETITYFPYGKTRTDSGSGRGLNYKYTGQELDEETGLYNYGARLYDPVLARFTSPDWIVQNIRNPQSLNRYAYVLNNPIRYIDPSGNVFIEGDLVCKYCTAPLPSTQPDPQEPSLDFGDNTNLVFDAALCAFCGTGGFQNDDLQTGLSQADIFRLTASNASSGQVNRGPPPPPNFACTNCQSITPEANSVRVPGGTTPLILPTPLFGNNQITKEEFLGLLTIGIINFQNNPRIIKGDLPGARSVVTVLQGYAQNIRNGSFPTFTAGVTKGPEVAQFDSSTLNMMVDLTRTDSPFAPELDSFTGFLYHEALHFLNKTSPTFNLTHGQIWRAQRDLVEAFPGRNTIAIPSNP